MLNILSFTFNPFAENTYIAYNEDNHCIVFDAGCSDEYEQEQLLRELSTRRLKVLKLVQTHCHLDHVYGAAWMEREFRVRPWINKIEESLLGMARGIAHNYGLDMESPPPPEGFLEEGHELKIGNDRFEIIHTPGHSPGSLCFINHEGAFILSGDVLFRESIGRTDLPGGNFEQLENAIRQKLYTLPDHYVLYPGHGPETTIGHEKKYNPFVRS